MQLENISKSFGEELVLDDIRLRISFIWALSI